MLKNKIYNSTEAKKMIAGYIDQSAIRLSLRLKKEFSVQKKQTIKTKTYA